MERTSLISYEGGQSPSTRGMERRALTTGEMENRRTLTTGGMERRSLTSLAGAPFGRLELGGIVESALEPGCTQYFVCDVPLALFGPSAVLTVELERESGDPLLMLSRDCVPTCDPLRVPIVDATCWDERAFDASLELHRVELALQQKPQPPRRPGRVQATARGFVVGVFNFYGVRHESAHFTLRADVLGAPSHSAAEDGDGLLAGPASPFPFTSAASSPAPSARSGRRLEGASRATRLLVLARPRESVEAQARRALKMSSREALELNEGPRTRDSGGRAQPSARSVMEGSLRALLHAHERLKQRQLSRALLSLLELQHTLVLGRALAVWLSAAVVDGDGARIAARAGALFRRGRLARAVDCTLAVVAAAALRRWRDGAIHLTHSQAAREAGAERERAREERERAREEEREERLLDQKLAARLKGTLAAARAARVRGVLLGWSARGVGCALGRWRAAAACVPQPAQPPPAPPAKLPPSESIPRPSLDVYAAGLQLHAARTRALQAAMRLLAAAEREGYRAAWSVWLRTVCRRTDEPRRGLESELRRERATRKRLESELIAAQAQVQAVQIATARTDAWLRGERQHLERQAAELCSLVASSGLAVRA
ncbi:hypothetical protein T492DRAFT_1117490 [Pavlovales sp. CCMP2436]|nr:hypothetical protein T492DRAFT_1117490 [Pavlovales sp. CCMP2436]